MYLLQQLLKRWDELIESGCEVIALDATTQTRPKSPLKN